MVPIHEDYVTYAPPPWARATIERLLLSLSSSHLSGLSAIVLTESTKGDIRKTGRRMRRNRGGVVVGRYHRATPGDSTWVEVIVDRIVSDVPKQLSWLQCVRDVAMARVLFHEIGHHLHATLGSASRGGELSADDWRRRLSAIHFKRYWYLRPALPLVTRFAQLAGRRERNRRVHSQGP